MTKARARKRAKARAAAKAAKPVAKGEKPGKRIRAGKFGPESNTVPNLGASAGVKDLARMKRGAARSR